MAKYCIYCGAELIPGARFCGECGKRIDPPAMTADCSELPTPVPEIHAATEESGLPTAPETIPALPGATPEPAPVADSEGVEDTPPKGKYGAVGFWAYFGLIALFSIPFVGFVAAIVMTFAPENRNVRRFALAALVWMLVGALLFGIVGYILGILFELIATAIGGVALELFAFFEEILGLASIGGLLGGFEELGAAIESIGDIGDILREIVDGIEQIGEMIPDDTTVAEDTALTVP